MMADSEKTRRDNWERIWEARIAALAPILGKAADRVYHAVVPFYLGGSADVLSFPDYVPGATYVTAELTGEESGQLPSSLGNYELMICARAELPRASDLVSQLARYTCDAILEPGETMDIGKYFADSSLRALLFAYPADEPIQFSLFGKSCGLLLCVGITADELALKQSRPNEVSGTVVSASLAKSSSIVGAGWRVRGEGGEKLVGNANHR